MINILFLYILTKFIPQINEIKKKELSKKKKKKKKKKKTKKKKKKKKELSKKKKKLGTIKKLMPNYQSYVLH